MQVESYTHPNHSGDVTSSGDGATTIANSAVTAAKIANNAVSLSKMADMATASFIGRSSSGTGDPQVLSADTARGIINHSNDKSRVVFAKSFSNTTLKIYDDNDLEIWWDSSQKQIKYKTTSSTWGYMDGSHLFLSGHGSAATTTPTAFGGDISSTSSAFQYISTDGNANSTFNLSTAYGGADRFTLLKESFSSGKPAFEGTVFIGHTNHIAIVLREIFQ